MKFRGFTLLEVLIALAILAITLTVLLQTQAQSLANAGRSRDISIAVLLARAKIIDIERKLYHEGFVLNSEDEEGNFREEGHEEITWKYRISDINLDMSSLSSLCDSIGGGAGGKDDGKSGSKKPKDADANDAGPGGMGDCDSLLGGLGGPMSSFTQELGSSMRVLDLLVMWSEGDYKQHLTVHGLLTRDDFQTAQDSDQAKQQDNASGALKAAGVSTGTSTGTGTGTSQ